MHGHLRLLPLVLLVALPLSAAQPVSTPPVPPAAPASPSSPSSDTAAFDKIREVLYGEADDASLAPVAATPAPGAKAPRLSGLAAKAEPLFAQAAARRQAGEATAAKETLHQILALPHLDSRRALRAWKALRELGETPEPPVADQVLGVIVEIDYEVEGEHALLAVAGYTEGDPVLAASSGYSLLGAKLRANTVTAGKNLPTIAQPLIAEVPKDAARRLPGNGQVRFVLLTPSGPRAQVAARKEFEDEAVGLHALYPLYVAGQQLLAALRVESERLEDGKRP